MSRMRSKTCAAMPALIEKTRYRQQVGDKLWEIDVFHGDNDGLIQA